MGHIHDSCRFHFLPAKSSHTRIFAAGNSPLRKPSGTSQINSGMDEFQRMGLG
jgi:hypothetical protein